MVNIGTKLIAKTIDDDDSILIVEPAISYEYAHSLDFALIIIYFA